ncbi:AIR synthase family protein [Vibrio sp. SS-MA-C1-2]|uniref:AIR synthase family protein n=1 Tax=Vibrio sp. SS-MA-C1-2 TaxID=2908646 RepID=UPI001F208614|nr:AIR synthase family protein [Vibrio sp. SS-MA-C1-2]UJF17927.1 AIR synthase family protein [Vibrio sp. SS-MA-C1-2]
MKIGKLNATDLQQVIFSNIHHQREEILTNPQIGDDCAVIDFGDKVAYLSSDPITGTSQGIGQLAININCNDIATAGVAPVAILLTILAPEGTTQEQLHQVMQDAEAQCHLLNVSIIGGHTEITKAVNQLIISATAIGIGNKHDYQAKDPVVAEDILLLTKGVGIEGTGIIAFEKEQELKSSLPQTLIEQAKSLLNQTSVVEEGIISSPYVKAMHDVTEGGVLGAVWELSERYHLGAEIQQQQLHVSQATAQICLHFNIDPLKLISSGSMLMIVDKNRVQLLESQLNQAGIPSFQIGHLTTDKRRVLINKAQVSIIAEPESDELYKVI